MNIQSLLGTFPEPQQTQQQQPQMNLREQVAVATADALRRQMEAQEYKQQILAAKNAYEAAQNDQIRRDNAEAADILRRRAAERGIDLTNYGADSTLNQTRTNYAADMGDLKRQLLYSENPDQFAERRYKELRAGGLSDRRATLQAGREAQIYNSQRLADFSAVIGKFGTENGALNDVGMQALMLMQPYADPNEINAYLNAYATPKAVNAFNNQVALTALGQQNKLAQMNVAQGYARQNAADNYNYNRGLQELKGAQQERLQERQIAAQERIANIRAEADMLKTQIAAAAKSMPKSSFDDIKALQSQLKLRLDQYEKEMDPDTKERLGQEIENLHTQISQSIARNGLRSGKPNFTPSQIESAVKDLRSKGYTSEQIKQWGEELGVPVGQYLK